MPENSAEYVMRTALGSWRISGTRVSLDSIVYAYWAGRMPEAMAADFPSLTLEQVHGAIAYYLRHRVEVDRHISALDSRWRHFQEESAARHGPLLQRIRQAAGQPTSIGPEQ